MMNETTDSETPELSSQEWTEQQVDEWFDKGEWLTDSQLKPHPSINKLEFVRQYHRHSERWARAFAYLNETDLINLAPGDYPIDGENVFAIVAEADKKAFDATRWESHRKYQDIQMVIAGKERMGIAPIEQLNITEPYSETNDIIFYQGDAGEYHIAEPNTFFIFFPQDGHRPDVKEEGFERDKKIVIKVSIQ